MAEERIDIEVTDKVDPNTSKKIHQIADASDRAFTYVEKLKAALSTVNTSAVDKLVSAMARADNAQAKLVNAQVRLSRAQDSGAMAAARLATQNQKLATEAARTEAATARAAAASSSAEAAALRLSVAQQRVTGTAMATGNAEEQLANDLSRAKMQFEAGTLSIRGYVAAMNQAKIAATGAGQPIVDSANRVAGASRTMEKAQSRTRSSNANIIAQLQDIGVSLAGGQNPLLVMIQQGSQLDYIARTTANGWSGLVMQMIKMIAPLTVVAAAIGGLYVAYKNFTTEIATRNKPELEAYAQTLGLTAKEMKKLSNETVSATGELKSFDQVTITAGDSWKGFIETVKLGLSGLVEGWGPATDYIKSAWGATTDFLYKAFLGFYALVLTTLELIWKTAVNVFKMVGNTVVGVFNMITMWIEKKVNETIEVINKLGDGANTVLQALGFETVIPKIDRMNTGIETLTDNMFKMETMDISKTFNERFMEGHRTIQGFAKAWEDAATAAAKARLAALAASIVQNRADGPAAKVDKTAEKRALAIGMVNLKLDDELARMRMLKDEREIQNRMDQIEQSLTQKKITLNDAERESILGKVKAIQEYKYVQAESDRILEEAVGPLRTMNATVEAATTLYDQGAISQDKYNQELQKATRIYDKATDPLHSYEEAISMAMKTTGLYGVELEKANYLNALQLDLLEKGESIYDANTGAITDRAKALIAENDALRQKQYIQSQLGGVLDPIMERSRELAGQAEVYAQLEAWRNEDLSREDAYQQAKAALWVKYNEEKLAASADFFGALASVTKRGTGIVGAISKAAAVAEATISGFVAVQRALASAPPPFNYVAAAAVAMKTGANVAGILSTNAGSFATGGQFMVQGKSGVDANNINMNVTKGERVTIETPKQQREADANVTTQSAPPVVNLKNVNVVDPRMALDALDTAEGNQVFINRIEANASQIRAVLGVG